MTLLEDVRAERAELSQEVAELARVLASEAREAVEATRACSPALFAVVGSRTHAYPLGWRSDWERARVLEDLAEHLAPFNPTATIFVYPCDFTDSQAVVIAIRSPGESTDLVLPYHLGHDTVTWADPFVAKTPIDSFLVMPCLN